MSKRPRAVYFQHLQKTGGTSLTDMLRPFFQPDRTADTGRYLEECDATGSPAVVAERYDFVAGHADIVSYAPPDAFKVAIFREPLARLLSGRRQLAQAAARDFAGKTSSDAIIELQRRSIVDVLDLVPKHIVLLAGFWNHQALLSGILPLWKARRRTNESTLRHKWSLQEEFGSAARLRSWLLENKGNILQHALQSLQMLDYVGLTEDLDNSVREIFARIGLPEPGDVLIRNARDPVGDEGDSRIRELAKEFIELDSELYEAAVERHALFGRIARGIPVDYLGRGINETTGLTIAANDAPGGHGWHPCHQRSDGGWSRWTGPGRESHVAVRSPAGTYSLQITAYGAVSEAAIRSMVVEIEGRALITEVVYQPTSIWTVTTTFERTCEDRFDLVLRFPNLEVDHGIELKQISFTPVSKAQPVP